MEIWIILEQVYIAALTVGNFDLSEKCITKLVLQFPNSITVKRLIGMGYEARNDFEKANESYISVLEEAPGDIMTMKRQVSSIYICV